MCQTFWDMACLSFTFIFDSFSPNKLLKNESSSNASNYISNR